jgi:hypothetical protein
MMQQGGKMSRSRRRLIGATAPVGLLNVLMKIRGESAILPVPPVQPYLLLIQALNALGEFVRS